MLAGALTTISPFEPHEKASPSYGLTFFVQNLHRLDETASYELERPQDHP